jgi:uncharacterized protein GlcG (DUF336 family)
MQNSPHTGVFFAMPTGQIGKLSEPGGSLFGIEHSNEGLITFPGGLPIVEKDGVLIAPSVLLEALSKTTTTSRLPA